MFCTTCGTLIDEGARFCQSCGQRVQRRGSEGASGEDAGRGRSTPSLPTKPSYESYSSSTGEARTRVPDYLVQAILVTVFCFLPTGIVSIIYAAQVNGKLARGDIAGARETSAKAKMWAWISFGLGLGFVILGLVGVMFIWSLFGIESFETY